MTIGPAGTVNTNVPPQGYGGVSSKQVDDFKELVNRFPKAERARGFLEGISAATGLVLADD